MTEETKDCKMSIKSSRKTVSSYLQKLNVPNFFTLQNSKSASSEIKSSSFEFDSATWQFRFQSYTKTHLNPADFNKSFNVYMVKVNSEIPKHTIFYTVTLLDSGDKKYDSDSGACVFDKGCSESYMTTFDKKNLSFDRCDILILIIHLVSDKALEVDADLAPLSVDGDIETLSCDFKKLLLNGKKHDLLLTVANKEFPVHQDILMARSQVFEAILTDDMIEKNKGVIDVPDCPPQAMEQFLHYMYCGKVENLNQENALGLYYLANKYSIITLKEECSKFIKKSISPSTFCDIVQLALKHSDGDLLECANEYFVRHMSEILSTVEWVSFLESNSVAANELMIKAVKKSEGLISKFLGYSPKQLKIDCSNDECSVSLL